MGEIFIIDDQSNPLVAKIVETGHAKPIEYYDMRSDEDLDEFTRKIFKNRDVNKLIIPISLGDSDNNLGLRIGLHIRLSTELGNIYLVPIIFVSDRSLETLLLDRDNKYALLATTEGTTICNNELQDILNVIPVARSANERSFHSEVLKNLIIRAPETTGPHSLANEWGVLQLNKVANMQALGSTTTVFNKKFSLYFKFLNRVNQSRFAGFSFPAALTSTGPEVIPSYGKKILYIDDEGYKGWTDVLSKIFIGASFTPVTDELGSETEFFSRINSEILKDWDLILLDLRLKPLQEDLAGQVHPVAEYSGAEILKNIKSTNSGVQVIIFTASNKAWNMRDLIDLGADGYYIKESPEYLIPDHLSLENYKSFKEQVNICFGRKDLRKLYKLKETAKAAQTSTLSGFISYSDRVLDDSFKLFQLGLQESGYLMLFQAIEFYAKYTAIGNPLRLVNQTGQTIRIKVGNQYLMTFNHGIKYYQRQTTIVDPKAISALGKISFVLAFKFNKSNLELIRLGTLVEIRNEIAHGSPVNLTTQDITEVIEMIEMFRSTV